MKKIFFIVLLLFVNSVIFSQFTSVPLTFNQKTNNASSSSSQSSGNSSLQSNDIVNNLPFLSISGLGNISSDAQTVQADPTANIVAELRLSKKRQWKLAIAYNLGTNLDSSNIDSLQIASLFFPDKSKSGFSMDLSYDIFRESFLHRFFSWIPTMDYPNTIDGDDNKSYFWTGEPFIDYSYLKKNITGSSLAIPRIETSTWLLGFRLGAQIISDKNTFGFSISPYYKWATVSSATYATYDSVFKKINNNLDLSHYAYFFGININFQINKTILGLTYEDLTKGNIYNDNIRGGVFTLKATIAADFFNF